MRVIGWLLVAGNLIGAAALFFGRDGGDAATRGLGRGLGGLLAAVALIAALLLWWGGRAGGRGMIFFIAGAVAVIPPMLFILFTTDSGLALLYPSRRGMTKQGPVPRYAFPNKATREVAMAVIEANYPLIDSLLKTTKPDLAARDEFGRSLLGLATQHAMVWNATIELSHPASTPAGGRRGPRPDDLGSDELLISALARVTGEPAAWAFEMLLKAGRSPNELDSDGRSVLFDKYLTPDAARVLLANGVSRTPRDPDAARQDWSPITVHTERERWATAHVLLDAGLPLDYATPPGSRFKQVMAAAQVGVSEDDSANVGFRALVAAAGGPDSIPR